MHGLDEWYFAHGNCTSMLHGYFGDSRVAVKVWRGASMSKPARRKFVQRLSIELDNWKRLDHHNITPFLGVVPGFGTLPALILPFYRNGHVNDYISKNPSTDILHLLGGLADALSYMHNLTPPVVHGDLKGVSHSKKILTEIKLKNLNPSHYSQSNVFVTDDGDACLCDIGLSNIPNPPDWSIGGCDGTRWMAPEVMDPGSESECNPSTSYVTTQSDVYSFGMTSLEMYTGRVPFAHRRFYGGVVFDVIRGVRPPRPECPKLTDDIWGVIQSCWNHDPKKRPTISAAGAWLHLLRQIRNAKITYGHLCSSSH
jgi:serine/threonine protein kinase